MGIQMLCYHTHWTIDTLTMPRDPTLPAFSLLVNSLRSSMNGTGYQRNIGNLREEYLLAF